MKKYFDTVINPATGKAISGATIQFLNSEGNPAVTYNDNSFGGAATSSTSDSTGFFQRYVPDGVYTLRASFGSTTVNIAGVEIFDDSEQDERINRAILMPEGEAGPIIPEVASRAGKYAAFDAEGNFTVTDSTGGADGTLRTDLAASGGSALVNFLQSGTGAAARSVQTKLRDFVSVKDFGATGDGVTDDTAAIQAALDLGGVIYFPAGTYIVTSTLDVGDGSASAISTINDVVLYSAGLGGASAQELGASGTAGTAKIKWAGASGGTVLSLNGPMTNTIKGLQIDGNDLAAVGILDTHSVGGSVEDVIVRRCSGSFIKIRAYENTPNCYVSAGAGRVFRNVKGWEPVAGSNFRGLDIGNETYAASSPGLDVARVTFIGCEFTRPSGASNDTLTLRMCDNLTFIRCFFYGPSATVGNSIAVRPATGNSYFPEDVAFYDASPVGAYYTDAAWDIWSTAGRGRGLIFSGLNDGDNNNQIPTHAGWSGYTYAMVPFGMIGAINRQGTLVSVTGTTSPATVYSYSVPGYLLNTNRRLRLKASGKYTNNTGGSVNIQTYAGYGGQTMFNGTVAIPTNASSGSWEFTVDFGAYDGSTAKQESVGEWRVYAAGAVGGVAQALVSGGLIGAHNNALTVDSTSAKTLNLVHTLGNTGAVIETHSVTLEII